MAETLSEALARECGGSPGDYRADVDELAPIDKAVVCKGEIDMSVDDLPVEFEELDLDEAAELSR